MKPQYPAPAGAARWQLREVRYSLRELLDEVAGEHESGAYGMEKLQQADIAKVFAAKSRPRRGSRDKQ